MCFRYDIIHIVLRSFVIQIGYLRYSFITLNVQVIGRFQAIKTDVLLIFSFITGDKTEFLSPMMFSNEYITEI